MEPLLFLAHRIPWPPDKGDKVRSYRLFRHFAERYRVFLGSFLDDPFDRQYVAEVRSLCAGCRVVELGRTSAKLRSFAGLLRGEALTLPYYRSADMSAWVREVVQREQIRKAFVFSAAMSQYVLDVPGLVKIFDFVDVDSAKWQAYGERHAWPMSWIYRREGERLLQFERRAAGASTAAIFVTAAEKDLFLRHAPEAAHKVVLAGNGVDAGFFSPDHDLPSPYRPDERPIVFTGAMDYRPNVDAGCWFADEILPLVRAADSRARLYIVGMNPAPEIRKRARAGETVVTGRVPDIRPYLRHAAVVVAPLRVARGIQNKVLEAMAMARPVITTPDCARGLSARPEAEIEVARDAADFAAKTVRLIDSPRAGALGRAARVRVLSDYAWEASLDRIEHLLSADSGAASKPDAFAAGRIGADLRSAAR